MICPVLILKIRRFGFDFGLVWFFQVKLTDRGLFILTQIHNIDTYFLLLTTVPEFSEIATQKIDVFILLSLNN